MKQFGRFYLDKEKDMIVDLFLQDEILFYTLRTPNHTTGNLIRNLARLCDLKLSKDEDEMLYIRGQVPSYYDTYNHLVYVFRLGKVKVANIYPDGTIEMKAAIPAISKTLMSQTKKYSMDIDSTIVKSYIKAEHKFRSDLHTHMNANLPPDILIAMGIMHQIRYPLYYIKKLNLRINEKQWEELFNERKIIEKQFENSSLKGKYLTRRIDDNTFINFARLILENPNDCEYNLARIRASLAVMKDGQAVFSNLEKVYLYRYVFTKGISSAKKVPLRGIETISDPEIIFFLKQMKEDRSHPVYKKNTLFQDKLLWIARCYAWRGITYTEISDTTLVKKNGAAAMLKQVHAVMPSITEETGVTIRFLAGIRRIPLTIVKDQVTAADYLKENIQVLKAVAEDPYVAGSDIVGEEINDIRELKPFIHELTAIAEEHPSFVIRIHAGENDSLRDNVFNAVECVKSGLKEGQKMPHVRIGHGLYTANLSSKKGKKLIDELLKNEVVLEFQITSNVRLNNLNTLKHHPLKQYLSAGIYCVQGTDGGALYGTDSMDEQLALEKLLQLTDKEMKAMRNMEADIIVQSMQDFREKQEAFQKACGKTNVESYFQRKIDAAGSEYGPLLSGSMKHDSTYELRKQITAMPEGKYPIIIAGGSFNNDVRSTKMRFAYMDQIDRLIEQCDPEQVCFVIGNRLNGYEKYLVDRCQGRFTIIAIIPSLISAYERNKLIESQVGIMISIEPTGMGLYKSFAYEIFKHQTSTVIAFDGNSAGANLIQEAKNSRHKAQIFVSKHSRPLVAKAESLEGYVTLFGTDDDIVPLIKKRIDQSVSES